jgi:hypothetical protein
MMDHIMNNKLSLAFGDYYARIPLKASPHIHNADALEIDWGTVIPAPECSYVFGNPPPSIRAPNKGSRYGESLALAGLEEHSTTLPLGF